jgi:uncharacterized protein with FMN-binding domain
MRRAPIALVLTAAGLSGLAIYRTRPLSTNIAGSSVSLSGGTAPTASTTSPPSQSTTSSATAPVVTSPSSSTTAPQATATTSTTTDPDTTTTVALPSTTTTDPATTTTSPPTTRSATGEVVSYGYGLLSVAVTVSRDTISKVSIASLDDGGNFRSQSIDEQSLPVLEQETLRAQSANVQSVSGASYTSEGFVQSLQNALSKLGF